MAKMAPISTSVEDAIDLWLGARSTTGSPKTVEQYGHAVARFVTFLGEGPVSLDDVDRATLLRYKLWLSTASVATPVGRKRQAGARLSPQTVASYMRAVLNLFNWCAESGLLNRANPATGRGLIPSIPRNPKRAPMTNEVQRLLAAVEQPDPEYKGQRRLVSAMNARSKALLWAILDTGMRASEIANLDLDDFDRRQGFLHIRDSKGGNSRFAFISPLACSALDLWVIRPREQLLRRRAPKGTDRRWLDALLEADTKRPFTRVDGPLFVDRWGGRMTAPSIRQWLRHLCERAGVPVYRPHDLRRFYITQTAGAGMPLPQLMRQIGHVKAETTMGYIVADAELQRRTAVESSPLSRLHPKGGGSRSAK